MVCRTPAGRIFSIFFIVSSVPMWFNILAQLGYFLHLLLFKLWTALRGFCDTRHYFKGYETCGAPPPVSFIYGTFLNDVDKRECTEVLIHQVHVTSYVVKFFSGPRDFKVGSFKPVFQVEFKNRVYSGDQAFIFELFW